MHGTENPKPGDDRDDEDQELMENSYRPRSNSTTLVAPETTAKVLELAKQYDQETLKEEIENESCNICMVAEDGKGAKTWNVWFTEYKEKNKNDYIPWHPDDVLHPDDNSAYFEVDTTGCDLSKILGKRSRAAFDEGEDEPLAQIRLGSDPINLA
ncbi:hypothetical protein OQA88_10550 [Cercophora sp. LCS_1]